MLLHIMKLKTTLPVHRTVWRYGVRRTQIFTIYMGQAGMKAQLNFYFVGQLGALMSDDFLYTNIQNKTKKQTISF